MNATQLLDAIAKWSDEDKSRLLRLLQHADKLVCLKGERDAIREERERGAKERERRQAKIAEIKKHIRELEHIRELDKQYAYACKENDLDMLEWVNGQFAALKRAYDYLYDEEREEIAREDA